MIRSCDIMKAAWFFFFVLLTAAILSAYSFSPSAEHVATHASESEWITFVHGSIGSLSDFCFQPPRPNRVACFHTQDTHCNQYSVENKHEQSTKSSLGEVGARTACTEKASLRSLPIRELGDELSGLHCSSPRSSFPGCLSVPSSARASGS